MNISAKTALAALTAVFMSASGGARASIIYDVDVSNANESVTGTITTDGTTGALGVADITAWYLTASGTVYNFAISSADIGHHIECGVDCGEASLSSLDFEFDEYLFLYTSGSPTYLVAFNANGADCNCVEYGTFSFAPADITLPALPAQTASVPEPSSLSTLAGGLFALGVGWRRRSRKDA